MNVELIEKKIRKKFLTECVLMIVAAIVFPFSAWAMGLSKVLISITLILVIAITFLFILTESLKYLMKKTMLGMYLKLEKEMGEYEIIKVLTGEKFNLDSEPSVLILTKNNDLFRIQFLKSKEFFKECVK
ncbi:hypothetical protein [Lysinibacillus fusiformis]|uniref:hypothetical protein n=1 Tax=Lysinibacillus fusiformis TaxID=28031 RepID=UPI00187E08D8|nr:hypothetical protein [Lysinibacillus fusiformis]MBD8523724.1 hypothetical protein [Lysinibacillus fusiformis]